MRRSLATLALLIAATTTLGLTACQPGAVPGRRCTPEGDYGVGVGRDAVNTYRCIDGRWRFAMTTAEAGRLLREALHAATSTTSSVPSTTSTTTTTSSTVAPCAINTGC